jgi:xanthine dehydrogenase YagS FAD-binding subunit
MRRFEHIDATTVDEAVSALGKDKAKVIAGGTDILGLMKFEILPEYPETLVNIKTIPGMDYIKEEGGMLKIGALASLKDIAEITTVNSKYTALAQAAGRAASPNLRVMSTIGGNICQGVRCWYYRANNNHFHCVRKGGGMCYATAGDNRFHSIFGAVLACIAVNPSDIAPALVVLDAKIITSKRTINVEDFWTAEVMKTTVLDDDEIVTEIQVPTPASGVKSSFIKFARRQSIDFPIVNCAAAIGGGSARICLNAVFNNPYRATEAEEYITGKTIDEANAEAAGVAAVNDAIAQTMNKYKIQIAKAMVKRAILACA